MKLIILAGGFGTRLSEETHLKPKPMVEIGSMPIIWHIMKYYSSFHINEFIICCGYKSFVIKEFFANYYLHTSDVTIDLQSNGLKIHNTRSENWKITLVDTGLDTDTAGRILKIKDYIKDEPRFLLTYGDGLSNVNINSLLKTHVEHGKTATVTAVQPAGRFGTLEINEKDEIKNFIEKPKGDGGWVNGGFFVFNNSIFDYILSNESLESITLPKLVNKSDINVYRHDEFWQPMDNLRDKNYLENLWKNNVAPWKNW